MVQRLQKLYEQYLNSMQTPEPQLLKAFDTLIESLDTTVGHRDSLTELKKLRAFTSNEDMNVFVECIFDVLWSDSISLDEKIKVLGNCCQIITNHVAKYHPSLVWSMTDVECYVNLYILYTMKDDRESALKVWDVAFEKVSHLGVDLACNVGGYALREQLIKRVRRCWDLLNSLGFSNGDFIKHLYVEED